MAFLIGEGVGTKAEQRTFEKIYINTDPSPHSDSFFKEITLQNMLANRIL